VHPVRGHYRRGKWVRPHLAHNPGRGRSASTRGTARPAKSAKGGGIAVVVTLVIGGVGAVVLSNLPGGTHASLSDDSGVPAASAEDTTEIRIGLSRTQAALIASGYRVNLDEMLESNCAAHSYGLVHRFFLSHPCKWVSRASLILHGNGGGAVLVAISWVDMSNTALAEQYKHLVDSPGTGNVTELTRDSGPYRNVRFTGDFYTSGIVGTAVWDAEVQPVTQLPTTVTSNILHDSEQ
jgi:hypothetical protein